MLSNSLSCQLLCFMMSVLRNVLGSGMELGECGVRLSFNTNFSGGEIMWEVGWKRDPCKGYTGCWPLLNKHGSWNLNSPHLQFFSLISTFFLAITTQLLPLTGMWKKASSCLLSHQMPSKYFIARIYEGKLHTRRLTSFMDELNMEAMYISFNSMLPGRKEMGLVSPLCGLEILATCSLLPDYCIFTGLPP